MDVELYKKNPDRKGRDFNLIGKCLLSANSTD